MYALVFLLTALASLALLSLLPDRGVLAAKARLQALEAVGPGLVHLADAKAWQVRDRRKARAERKRMAERAALVLRVSIVMFVSGSLAGLAFRFFGTQRVLLVLTMAGIASAVLVPAVRSLRIRHVNRQIPRALGVLAKHLETTNSLFAAIDEAAASGPWPIRAEFRRISAALRGNATVDQAVQAFAARNPVPEAHLAAKILSAPQTSGQSMVAALLRAEALLGEFNRAEAKAAAWGRLRALWAFGLTVAGGELALLGILRSERPLGLFLALSAVSLTVSALWWFGRRKSLERSHLEGRLGLLDLDVDGAQPSVWGPAKRPVHRPPDVLQRVFLLGRGQSARLQRLSDASVRALCHVACMLQAGLSLESAIGAVVLRPGKRGRLEQELFALLQEVRSGSPPHAAALALAVRCDVPELRGFAAALAPGNPLCGAMQEVAHESLGAWPARARAAALAGSALAAAAALAALIPLAALAFG